LLLKDFRCWLFAFLVDVLRVEFVFVLMMISPVPFRGLIFFFHLGASRKKQPEKARAEVNAGSAEGRRKESKPTDNMLYRWREGCIPRRPESLETGEARGALAGEMRTASETESHRRAQNIAEETEGSPVSVNWKSEIYRIRKRQVIAAGLQAEG
jgi:hypothetical protein